MIQERRLCVLHSSEGRSRSMKGLDPQSSVRSGAPMLKLQRRQAHSWQSKQLFPSTKLDRCQGLRDKSQTASAGSQQSEARRASGATLDRPPKACSYGTTSQKVPQRPQRDIPEAGGPEGRQGQVRCDLTLRSATPHLRSVEWQGSQHQRCLSCPPPRDPRETGRDRASDVLTAMLELRH